MATYTTAKLEIPLQEAGNSPQVRLLLIMAAQAGGYGLLFVLGSGVFPIGMEAISRGLIFIIKITWSYLIISLAFPSLCLAIPLLRGREVFEHFIIDVIMFGLLALDVVCLFLLVSQEGGLCRSMFLPVFFLIPTAYLATERQPKEYLYRKLFVLATIGICIYFSYRIAIWLGPSVPGLISPVHGTLRFWRWSMTITDFSGISHPNYDQAIYYACMISAAVPIIQILALIIVDRYKSNKEKRAMASARTLPG